MSTTQLTEDDEGKPVVTPDGEQIGMIAEVSGGTAHVDPNPDTFDKIKAKLDWGDVDDDTYPLNQGDVAEVTDDQVRLR